MAQHDYAVANAPGATVRADLNNALSAITTNNSGASNPATTFAYEFWADTTNGVYKRRNSANSGWLLLASAGSAASQSKSGGYTVVMSDYGTLIKCTSSFTLALTAAATLTDGFWCDVRNDGTGVITIDPNGAETIDGLTTLALPPGAQIRIFCDGSNFRTLGRKDVELLSTQTASSSATIDFVLTAWLTGQYSGFEVRLSGVRPATDAVNLILRTSTNAGSSYDAGASDYSWAFSNINDSSTVSDNGATASTSPQVGTSLGNASTKSFSGEIKLYKPTSAAFHTLFQFDGVYVSAANSTIRVYGIGRRLTAADVDAIRFVMSAGNIAEGDFALYGIR